MALTLHISKIKPLFLESNNAIQAPDHFCFPISLCLNLIWRKYDAKRENIAQFSFVSRINLDGYICILFFCKRTIDFDVVSKWIHWCQSFSNWHSKWISVGVRQSPESRPLLDSAWHDTEMDLNQIPWYRSVFDTLIRALDSIKVIYTCQTWMCPCGETQVRTAPWLVCPVSSLPIAIL